jgi:SagB-type dehydrogenase family enzyme
LSLPPSPRAGAAVLDVIQRRRSARSFDDRPLALVDLSAVIADATRPARLLSDAVRAYVVANRVEGLERGAYRVAPDGSALVAVRRGDLQAEARDAALAQEVIGGAAAVVVLTLDRQVVFRVDGARGYRHGMLEAGMIGERLLLGAVARDLGACPVGAFYDDEAVALLGVDGAREWPVHFAALGP